MKSQPPSLRTQILRTKDELRAFRAQIDCEFDRHDCSKNPALDSRVMPSVGLVPTMGALHAGHKSLIQKSLAENSHTIVSIFVNPTQFAPGEDFSRYPRTFEQDYAMCAELGVSAVFAPEAQEMYAPSSQSLLNSTESTLDKSAILDSHAIHALDEISLLPPKSMGYVLEGFTRPSHFAGVLQIVMKLFMLTRAHNAYFGRKDAQQLLIVSQMVRDLCIPITIHGCEIVRDDDGLAFSSRNRYLQPEDRAAALALPRALESIRRALHSGITKSDELQAIGLQALQGVEVEYLEIVNERLELVEQIDNRACAIVLLAARVGGIRLLDNLWLESKA